MSNNNDAWDDWETAADAGIADYIKTPTPPPPKPTNANYKQNTDQANAILWRQANEYATPTVIRTDTVQTQYQPEIKILKRSKDTSQRGGRSNTTGGPVKTLEQREKDYMLARQRIFGEQINNGTNNKKNSDKPN
ncbi:hypothetical protein BC941DRAFT_417424 [Chlamydoabsidia padenii]|nr:hypothetical protein BC941DRAFT_417424 [Chlamydoabsidia padenii]